MAERKYLRITQKIQISKDGKTWFGSSIQDLNPDTFSITIPYLKERPLVAFKGDPVKIKFFDSDCSYQFATYVTGQVEDNIRLYQLAYPEQIKRIQQRMHVRLPVLLDVSYAPVKKNANGGDSPNFVSASSVNISGAGMRLAVRQPVQEGEMLLLKFYLPIRETPEYLELTARVIRCTMIDEKTKVYHLGLEYDSINHRQQDTIVRFIFEKMAVQKKLV